MTDHNFDDIVVGMKKGDELAPKFAQTHNCKKIIETILDDVEFLMTKAEWVRASESQYLIVYGLKGFEETEGDTYVRLERMKGDNHFDLLLMNKGWSHPSTTRIPVKGFKQAQEQAMPAIISAMRDKGFRPNFKQK